MLVEGVGNMTERCVGELLNMVALCAASAKAGQCARGALLRNGEEMVRRE